MKIKLIENMYKFAKKILPTENKTAIVLLSVFGIIVYLIKYAANTLKKVATNYSVTI